MKLELKKSKHYLFSFLESKVLLKMAHEFTGITNIIFYEINMERF